MSTETTTSASSPFFSFKAKKIDGTELDFNELKGKVVLVVNTASQCGFTGQYKGLQQMYEKHKDKGFQILAFPCNQFGNQEPASNDDINSFCSLRFNVTFQLMDKVDVNGPNEIPLYAYLKKKKKQMFMERIKWNFEKFLIDQTGTVRKRFSSMADPMTFVEPEVSKLLQGLPVSEDEPAAEKPKEEAGAKQEI